MAVGCQIVPEITGFQKDSLMSNRSAQERLAFIDHLRAFTFALLAFDHTMHAYALNFGRFHFFKDFDRTIIGDICYLHNNSVIMPMLFFIFGMFVLPAYHQKGGWTYFKERFLKLGIPYLIGIPFVVPLLVFPRYLFNENPASGYWEFWREVYFVEKMQGGGPFWVLFCLALFSAILIAVSRLFPFLNSMLGRFFRRMVRYPWISIPSFILISMIILGLSDLRWGAPWWIGFGHIETNGEIFWIVVDKILNLFHLQGSRFLLHALYFLTGTALSVSGFMHDQRFWKSVSDRWISWFTGMVISGSCYIGYTLAYLHDGAYSEAVQHFLYAGGSWEEVGPILIEHAPGVLVRTSLHGIFVFFQVVTLLSLFHRFVNTPTPFWTSLATCSYGIFLLHEIPVIWLQYALNGHNLPITFKVIIIYILGFGGTWCIVSALRRITTLRRIL
jgi:glucan biosynthesis protein C